MRVARALEDDRLYRLEVVAWGSPKERPWAMVTLHNVYGRIPARQDYFATREEALEYSLQVVVETPRVSLGSTTPDPLPSIEEYTEWLKAENLHDQVLNAGDLAG